MVSWLWYIPFTHYPLSHGLVVSGWDIAWYHEFPHGRMVVIYAIHTLPPSLMVSWSHGEIYHGTMSFLMVHGTWGKEKYFGCLEWISISWNSRIWSTSDHLTSDIWGRFRYKTAPQGYLASGDAYTHWYDKITIGFKDIVTAQKQPQPQQQSNRWEYHHPHPHHTHKLKTTW